MMLDRQTSVYVGNVDYSVTVELLKQHFKDCGEVTRVTIPHNAFNNPKGFAYMQFAEVEGMKNALLLDDSILVRVQGFGEYLAAVLLRGCHHCGSATYHGICPHLPEEESGCRTCGRLGHGEVKCAEFSRFFEIHKGMLALQCPIHEPLMVFAGKVFAAEDEERTASTSTGSEVDSEATKCGQRFDSEEDFAKHWQEERHDSITCVYEHCSIASVKTVSIEVSRGLSFPSAKGCEYAPSEACIRREEYGGVGCTAFLTDGV